MLKYMWRVKTNIHSSWLIAIASVALLVGVIIVPGIDQTFFAPYVWLVTGIGLVLTVLWRRTLYLIPLIIVGGMLIGLWRGSTAQTQLVVYQQLYGKVATVAGTVSEDADIGKNGELVLRLNSLSVDGHMVAGTSWVSVKTNADIKRGDSVFVTGKIQQGFGSFSSALYRATLQKVERPEPGDVARQVRDWFADAVRVAIPDPQAALGIGYLVGQRRALPPELDQALQIAGLTHVVVASGYNLTILVRLARRLFMKISKYTAALAATGMIASFVAITGSSPSMSRAGLVAGLSLLAWYYGRSFHPLVLLPLAAATTVLINPSFAWGDLGWQLSFAAFAGVMIVAPLGQAYFFGDKKPGIIRQILGETIAAHIVTLPILVLAFSQFSNVAIIANILVLPLVPLAMLLTFLAGIGTLITPAIAPFVGMPANVLLQYMVSVAEYLSKLSWAIGEITIQPWQTIVAYVCLIAVCIYLWRVTKYNLRDSNIVE
jgi:competence protein ComEC